MSRPIVSMLCDAGRLGKVVQGADGHRWVQVALVMAYIETRRDKHRDAPTLREAGINAALYDFPDDHYVTKFTRNLTFEGRLETTMNIDKGAVLARAKEFAYSAKTLSENGRTDAGLVEALRAGALLAENGTRLILGYAPPPSDLDRPDYLVTMGLRILALSDEDQELYEKLSGFREFGTPYKARTSLPCDVSTALGWVARLQAAFLAAEKKPL